MIYYILLFGIGWLLWRALRSFLARSPLDEVPGPESVSKLTGNLTQIMDTQGWDFHAELAEQYGSVVKINGLFGKPWLYVFDPLALQHIVRDVPTYDELPWYIQSNQIMLGPGVLSVTGDLHRKQRKMLTPAFSAEHLRGLLPIFYQVTHKLVHAISVRTEGGTCEVDVMGWMARAALELIGQTGIGYSFDPLTEDVADAYADAVKRFAPESTCAQMMLFRQLAPLAGALGPAWFRRFLVERLPMPRCVRRVLCISDTLHARSSAIFREKKDAVEGQGADEKDIISILLKANMHASEEDRLPDDQLLGQMSSILFAAMDTTSNVMARILHLLTLHPEVQVKLRREIVEARVHGELSYDQLHALPYFDAVCKETLRLFAPAPQTFRGAMKDAVLPLSQPLRTARGDTLNSLVVPKGTNIIVGIMACNRQKSIWGPDALEWRPERWLAPLPRSVEEAGVPGLYSNMMTFLGGARSCIGMSFSLLEMKVVLSELLLNFTFDLSDSKPVFWNLSGITYPSTSPESTKFELWLKVRRISASDES